MHSIATGTIYERKKVLPPYASGRAASKKIQRPEASYCECANKCPNIEDHVLLFTTIAAHDDIILQSDDAHIHTAASTKEFLQTLRLSF